MTEIKLTEERARAVMQEATKEQIEGEGPVYPGSIPDDPSRLVNTAQDLVKHAVEAWSKDNMRGVEVASILKAAGVSVGEDGTPSQDGAPQGESAPEEPRPTLVEASSNYVRLVAEDGSEIEVPQATVEVMLKNGYSRPAEPETSEPLPDSLTVLIAGVETTLPYDNARALIDAGAATQIASAAPSPEAESLDTPAEEQAAVQDGSGDDPEPTEMEEPWDGYNDAKGNEIVAQMDLFTAEEIGYVKQYEGLRPEYRRRQRIMEYDIEKRGLQRRKAAKGEKEAEPEDDRPDGASADAHADLDSQADDAVARDDSPAELSTEPDPEAERQEPAEPEERHYGSVSAVAEWKVGLYTIDERAAKNVAERRKSQHVLNAERKDPETGKPRALDRIEYEAEWQDDVQEFRDRQHMAGQRKVVMSKLAGIYSGNVETCSRQWSYREAVLKSSGGLHGRS